MLDTQRPKRNREFNSINMKKSGTSGFFCFKPTQMKSFADQYIQKQVIYPPLIDVLPDPQLSIIVMIPCLNEPEIERTIESLWKCNPIQTPAEVIVVINNSEKSSEEIRNFNSHTLHQLQQLKTKIEREKLRLHPIYVDNIPAKFAGAGMARKIGMDEAIRRLNQVSNPNGIIVSLDSDCLVSGNYLQAIAKAFLTNKKCFAANIDFKHRIDELSDEKQRVGIGLYETYLHYYKNALEYTGFPDAIHTIGSAFAVRADAYIKQGGMNRRQAGEDFYFLNKLTKLGRIHEINDATVFPSGRVSDRVPFGTGAAMTKWMDEKNDLTQTYSFSAFVDIKKLFDQTDDLFRKNSDNVQKLVNTLPESLKDYLHSLNFTEKIEEINRYSSSPESFRKRFFQFFDAFAIMRFLNITHQSHYSRQNLLNAVNELNQAKRAAD